MRPKPTRILFATLACLAAASVSAAPVLIRETGLANGEATNSLILPVQSGAANYWAGTQTILINNTTSALAFCADPWEWSPGSNQTYNTATLDGIFGTTKANDIRTLYALSYGSVQQSGATGNSAAAAFQLALWEIIADGDLRLDGTGLVRTTASTNQSLVSQANALLSQVGSAGNINANDYSFTLYVSGKSDGVGNTPGYQDYLVANRIPEPNIGLLMATALGAALMLARRREQHKPGKRLSAC